ncbi:MAG: DUF3782 domain-containing protein [Magnetococcales bacterium]|nr:DUF3782 domain-containing protein [Magnetococcales bacterium]
MSQNLTIDDIWKLFHETNRLFRESEARMAHDLQETRRILQESRAETERKSQETDKKIKEVTTLVGRLGGRWGEFVEGLVAPACETLFAQRGIPIHQVSPHVKAALPGNRHMEIDLLVANTDVVALVEVKSRLTSEDVREHQTRMAEFKEFFPIYADKRAMGAMAGILIDKDVDRHVMNAGFFLIVQSGDSVQLANDMDFVPRVW